MTDIADKLADALREAMYMNWVEGNSLGNHAPEYFKHECLELLRYHEAKKKQIDTGRRSR